MADADISRRPLAVALVAAPLFWLVAEAISPALKSDAAAQLAVVAQHADRWFGYTVLLVLGTVLFVPAILGIVRLSRPKSPRLAVIGGALLGYGTIIAVGDAMTQLMTWQMVAHGADRSQMAALLDRFDKAGGAALLFGPGGLAFAVGSVLLTVALIRTRVIPVWASVAFLIGMVLQLVGFTSSSVVVTAVSAVVALIGSSVMAARLWTAPESAPVTARTDRPFVPAI